jgi:glucose/arabinose dehydrogenase
LQQRFRARRRTGVTPDRTGLTVSIVMLLLVAGCTGVTSEDSGGPGAVSSPPVVEDAPAGAPPPRTPSPRSEARGLPPADVDLPALTLEEVATLDAPIDTVLLEDGTVLVAERGGVVRVLLGARAGEVVIDISDRTTTGGERGLLSIAVTPAGDALILSLTDPSGDTLIESHPLSGSVVTGAPRILYRVEQPFPNHNGGPVLFLPDGTLLLGLGDGGGAGDPLGAGQDLATPLGALVRLSLQDDGAAVPADNPFITRDGAAPEILAYGLRNPWRIALDDARGELWIADVGQSEREEINRVPVERLAGANFGWALREGTLPYLGDEPADHVAPLYEYAHGPGCSVTGGVVYRGAAIPELVGGYVFTDLCDGELRVLVTDGLTVSSQVLGVSGTRVVGFGTDADGELLVLELGGRVLRLVPS